MPEVRASQQLPMTVGGISTAPPFRRHRRHPGARCPRQRPRPYRRSRGLHPLLRIPHRRHRLHPRPPRRCLAGGSTAAASVLASGSTAAAIVSRSTVQPPSSRPPRPPSWPAATTAALLLHHLPVSGATAATFASANSSTRRYCPTSISTRRRLRPGLRLDDRRHHLSVSGATATTFASAGGSTAPPSPHQGLHHRRLHLGQWLDRCRPRSAQRHERRRLYLGKRLDHQRHLLSLSGATALQASILRRHALLASLIVATDLIPIQHAAIISATREHRRSTSLFPMLSQPKLAASPPAPSASTEPSWSPPYPPSSPSSRLSALPASCRRRRTSCRLESLRRPSPTLPSPTSSRTAPRQAPSPTNVRTASISSHPSLPIQPCTIHLPAHLP